MSRWKKETNSLFYDVGLQWEEGTPAWVESAYVAIRILPPVPSVRGKATRICEQNKNSVSGTRWAPPIT